METMIPQAERETHSAGGMGWKEEKGMDGGNVPEEKDSCRFSDLVVRQNVSKLLGDVANAFDDGIQALTWIDYD